MRRSEAPGACQGAAARGRDRAELRCGWRQRRGGSIRNGAASLDVGRCDALKPSRRRVLNRSFVQTLLRGGNREREEAMGTSAWRFSRHWPGLTRQFVLIVSIVRILPKVPVGRCPILSLERRNNAFPIPPVSEQACLQRTHP
jgi:hypothetical protein